MQLHTSWRLRLLVAAAALLALFGCAAPSRSQAEQQYLATLQRVYGSGDAFNHETLLSEGRASCGFKTAADYQKGSALNVGENEASVIFDAAHKSGLCNSG